MRFHLLALAFLPTLLAQGAGAAETEVATQEGQEAETLATKTNNNDIADVDLDPIAPAKEDAAKESTNDSKDLFADFKFPTDEKPTTTASDDFFGEEASKEATATDEPEALPSLDDFLTSPTTPKETEEKTSDDETTTAEDTVKEDATEEEAAKEDGTEEETTDLTPASTKKDLHLGFGGPQTGPCIYNVIIKTGNKRYAGTDADVFVQFGDGHGRSVNAFLDRPYRNDFERNALNQFTVNSVVTIPDICSLVIGHNRKHPGSDWYVEYVTIQTEGRSWKFPIEGWIGKDKKTGRAVMTINRCPPVPVGAVAGDVPMEPVVPVPMEPVVPVPMEPVVPVPMEPVVPVPMEPVVPVEPVVPLAPIVPPLEEAYDGAPMPIVPPPVVPGGPVPCPTPVPGVVLPPPVVPVVPPPMPPPVSDYQEMPIAPALVPVVPVAPPVADYQEVPVAPFPMPVPTPDYHEMPVPVAPIPEMPIPPPAPLIPASGYGPVSPPLIPEGPAPMPIPAPLPEYYPEAPIPAPAPMPIPPAPEYYPEAPIPAPAPMPIPPPIGTGYVDESIPPSYTDMAPAPVMPMEPLPIPAPMGTSYEAGVIHPPPISDMMGGMTPEGMLPAPAPYPVRRRKCRPRLVPLPPPPPVYDAAPVVAPLPPAPVYDMGIAPMAPAPMAPVPVAPVPIAPEPEVGYQLPYEG